MKKFRYRFASLENVRGLELDNLRMELRGAQQKLEEALEQQQNMLGELEQSYDEIARLRASRGVALLQESLGSYTALLKRRLQDQAGLIEKRRNELEQVQQLVSEKHQETRVLEKHRERQFGAYLQEMERDMQRELDETAGNGSRGSD
ncbi:MAG: flagellar FliJ family protein [bacterium]